MAALLVARVAIKDADKFQEYVAKSGPTMAEFGGELLFRGKTDKDLTGGGKAHQVTAIFKFPGVDKLNDWYASDAYQAVVPLRDEGADIQFISYELMG